MTYRIQKICVVGNTASGKSFFARRVGETLGLPVFHLDQIYWNADWSHVTRTVFQTRQEKLAAGSQWVIDRPRILRTARKTGTPLLIIHHWNEEDAALAKLSLE